MGDRPDVTDYPNPTGTQAPAGPRSGVWRWYGARPWHPYLDRWAAVTVALFALSGGGVRHRHPAPGQGRTRRQVTASGAHFLRPQAVLAPVAEICLGMLSG